MKNKFLLLFLIIFLIFFFSVFYKGIKIDNSYKPNSLLGKKINNFIVKDFYSDTEKNSHEILTGNKYYIVNIWAAWCRPCRVEHPKLMELSKKKSIKLIGINYRDNKKKAKKFLNDFGNPFSIILYDKSGTTAIELGAYGIPETFLIDNNKKIIKKYLGALNEDNLNEIYSLIK